MQPKAIVLTGYGINCEEETAFAFNAAGAKADIVHINDFIEQPKRLEDYSILAFPGGFSYGDDLGSGLAFANKLKNKAWKPIKQFLEQEKLVIGICNGFQILANLGVFPSDGKSYGKQEVALMANDNNRYTCRWVDLRVENQSPWLKGIESISLPIAHGEGKFYAEPALLKALNQNNQVALRYTKGEISSSQELPYNPNGALEDIAGITNRKGNVLGLMPHPERAIFFTQHPHWTAQKETLLRSGQALPQYGPSLKLFQNAVAYAKEQF